MATSTDTPEPDTPEPDAAPQPRTMADFKRHARRVLTQDRVSVDDVRGLILSLLDVGTGGEP